MENTMILLYSVWASYLSSIGTEDVGEIKFLLLKKNNNPTRISEILWSSE